jgi:VanZ family protein
MLQAFYNLRMVMFLGCVAALLYGIFRAAPPPDLFDQSDKVGHLLAFGALGLSSRLAFLRLPGLVLWPILAGLAPLLEWLQHQLQPLRIYSLEDALANLSGVALALVFWVFIRRYVSANAVLVAPR